MKPSLHILIFTFPQESNWINKHLSILFNPSNTSREQWCWQKHRTWMTTVWWWKRRRERRRVSHSCHLLLIQLALAWKLSWHSDFAINNTEPDYLGAIRGQKLSLVIASSLHGKFIYLCCITAQYSHVHLSSLPKEKGPRFLLRTDRYAESESQSFGRRLASHSPPLSNSWQTYTVGLLAESRSRLPRSGRWAKP